MLIIINILIFTTFCHYEFLCDNLNPQNQLLLITYFMTPPPDLLYDAIFKYPWDATAKTPHLKGTP